MSKRSAKMALASQIADEILSDPDYINNLKIRIKAGDANHIETLLYHYKYGKPTDTVQVLKAEDDLSEMSNEEISALVRSLEQELHKLPPSDDDAVNSPAVPGLH